MVTPATARWPKPRDHDEFENIAADALKVRWDDVHVQRLGRSGQKQHGVDILGYPSRLSGRCAGAQCKHTDKLTLKVIKAEIEKAKHFKPPLAEFVMVTSGLRDARLQEEVLKLPHEPFPVKIMFWDDVTQEVSKQPEMVAKHWQGFGLATTAPASIPLPDTLESSVEAVLCIRPDGVTIDELVVVTLRNEGQDVIDLEFHEVVVRWLITDAPKCETHLNTDGLGEDLVADSGFNKAGSFHESVLLVRGTLAPDEERHVGFAIVRHGGPEKLGDEWVFQSPYLEANKDQAVRLTIVVPPDLCLSHANTEKVGPRHAMWEFNAGAGRAAISASWRALDSNAPRTATPDLVARAAERLEWRVPRYLRQPTK